ncbi:MAG TPA: hypothetical protein PKC79_07885 [Solidesulfovibrio magneticus]|nr:hypothetical protein [Solidesulfovibrio magneticus]
MTRALFWKEWLKVRAAFVALAAAHAAAGVWAVVALRAAFAAEHPESVWYQAAVLGNVSFDILRHLPWAGGLALACAQHLPETRGKRLRLTLHLPVTMQRALSCSLALGLGLCACLAAWDLAVVGLSAAARFPREIVTAQLAALAPWEAAGLAAYLGATSLLFEPTTAGRAQLLLVAAGVAAVFLLPAAPGAWGHPGALTLGLTLLAALTAVPFLAVSRQRLTGKNQ